MKCLSEADHQNMRRIFDIPPTEAKGLFTYLERLGVTTCLDDYSRQKAISSLDSLINQATDRPKARTVDCVASVILLQLRKSKEIDVDFFNQAIQFYPNIRGPPPSEKTAIVWEDDDEEEEKEEEEDEVDELSDPEDDDSDLDLFRIDLEELEKQKAKERVPTDQDKIELLNVCSEWGCTLKKGHEQNILNLLIPFMSTNFPMFSCHNMDRRICMKGFFDLVLVDYVDSTCTLKDLETVNHAIETVKKTIEEEDNRKKEQQSYCRLLRKITVPTNEAFITPMNQFNQEKRENLAEQKDICLTTSVNEQTKEYGNVVTPLKAKEAEENNRVDIDECLLAPECKDMEKEKPRKRKLEFSHPVSV